eukprot:GHRQ01020670.1.p1 GENE.GHRQ01020670.1~~GHRQ01020670.1.p1  ORF type:complete len:423 (+),score=89.04 GHRQ01020670.1:275-1543(+)
MGGCCSSPADQYEPGKQQAAGSSSHHHHHQKGQKQEAAKTPDFGLGEDFEVIRLLGTGGEGETWLCVDQRTKQEVAIKLVRRPIPRSITQIIQREIKILADLGDGHLNIVHADEVLLTKTHVGLVMEYVAGGNMVAFVTKRRETRESRGGLCIDEDEASFFFRQLIWAVQFCHRNHVAHRDLKLDNTILDHRDPPRLKLCDFGFAKAWASNSNMDTMRIGTPEYMGPELISGRAGYDGKKVDVWAAGVLLFVMLLGMFPFEMEDENYVNTAGMTRGRDGSGSSNSTFTHHATSGGCPCKPCCICGRGARLRLQAYRLPRAGVALSAFAHMPRSAGRLVEPVGEVCSCLALFLNSLQAPRRFARAGRRRPITTSQLPLWIVGCKLSIFCCCMCCAEQGCTRSGSSRSAPAGRSRRTTTARCPS